MALIHHHHNNNNRSSSTTRTTTKLVVLVILPSPGTTKTVRKMLVTPAQVFWFLRHSRVCIPNVDLPFALYSYRTKQAVATNEMENCAAGTP